MKFRYTARPQEGELQAGNIEALDRQSASTTLLGHNLYVLSLESPQEFGFFDRLKTLAGGRVRSKDIMIFMRQFATLIEAEIPLADALKALYRQTSAPVLKETISDIGTQIDSGLSLSQAFERHPLVFSKFSINILRSAEITGRINEALLYLADYLEREVVLKHKVRNAMLYPAIVIGLFVVVVIVMAGGILPQLKPIFEESKVDLPFFTKLIFGMGSLLFGWWWLIIIIMLVTIFLFVDYFRTAEGRAVFDEITIQAPIIGSLFKKMYIARFADAMVALIKGGIPIVQAVEIAGITIDNVVYKDALHEAAQKVKAGSSLSQALAEHEFYFPAVVTQMLAIGESTGRLEAMFRRITNFYTQEVDSLVSNLVELIQPALMIVIGLLIGILFASLLIPIYSLVQTF